MLSENILSSSEQAIRKQIIKDSTRTLHEKVKQITPIVQLWNYKEDNSKLTKMDYGNLEIESFPFPVVAGETAYVDGKPIGVIKETRLVTSQEDFLLNVVQAEILPEDYDAEINEAISNALCNGDGRATSRSLRYELAKRGLVIVKA